MSEADTTGITDGPVFETTSVIDRDEAFTEPASFFGRRHQFNFHVGGERYLKTELALLGPLKLGRATSSGHTARLTEPEYLTYLLPRNGTLDVSTRTDHFRAQDGGSLLFGPISRLTRVIPEQGKRMQALALLIPAREIANVLAADQKAAPSEWPSVSVGHHNRPISERALRDYLTYLERECDRPGSPMLNARVRMHAAALTMDLFAQLILDCMDASAPDEAKDVAGQSSLERAKEVMHEQFDQPLTVSGIAEVAGVSARALQISFRSAFGETPRETLNRIRMEAARLRLTNPSDKTTVAEIALSCGFSHLARFAATYEKIYGEPPVETLRRALSLA